jgi:hypothetical protein
MMPARLDTLHAANPGGARRLQSFAVYAQRIAESLGRIYNLHVQ